MVEIKDREFDAKLLLANYAVSFGYKVIVGEKDKLLQLIFANLLPPGIVYDKSIQGSSFKVIKKIKEAGNRLVSIDEEAVAILEKEIYIKERYSEDTIKASDMIFTWGENHYEMVVEAFPKYKDKVFIAGNVRVDTTRDPYRSIFLKHAEKIVDRYGDFILIPSNFAVVYHKCGGSVLDVIKGEGNINSKEDLRYIENWIKYVSDVYETFRELIVSISNNFPDKTIIFRPHPSDNVSIYKEHFKNLKNVICVYEGNIYPWLLAAKAIIHNGCTTGSEAFLLERNVFSYHKIPDTKYTLLTPNELSIRCETIEQMEDYLKDVFDGKEMKEHREAKVDFALSIFQDYLGNFAYEETVSKLNTIAFESGDVQFNNTGFKLAIIWMQIRSKIKLTVISFFAKFGRVIDVEKANRGKFPLTSNDEVVQKLDELRRANNKLPEIDVENIMDNCFILSRK